MKFSIIIPTYNRAVFLPKAIESVMAQTYHNWELIVVDDGSTDNTREVVQQYSDKRIIYMFQENAERSAARNNGIRHANGDVICFMDSDNYYLPKRLSNLNECIESQKFQIAMFYTDIIYFYPESGKQNFKRGKAFAYPLNYDKLFEDVIATPQVCISKEILQKHTFNEQFNVGEDMELWFRIAEENPVVYIEEEHPTVYETEHEGRSVNYFNFSNVRYLNTLRFMFSRKHPAHNISHILKKRKLSDAYLRAAYYFLFANKQFPAIVMLMKSLLLNINNPRTQFKLNLLRFIIFRNFNKARSII